MKRKNVVLVYDLLLEMLDANTPSSNNSQASPSPSSDTYPDQQQYPDTPSHVQPGSDQTTEPAEDLILDRNLQSLPLQSPPTFQRFAVAHMDSNK